MVKQIYKTAIIGPSAIIKLASSSKFEVHLERSFSFISPIELEIKELTRGWNVDYDEQHYKVCG